MSEDVIDEPVAVANPWEGEAADAVRATRDNLIANTDWMVLPDSPYQRNMASRAAVWLYRQALRDITSNFASPEDVEWPEVPVL